MPSGISRRDVLKSLTVGVSTGSVLRMIPLEAAEHVHGMVREEQAQAAGGVYTPKFFPRTLTRPCGHSARRLFPLTRKLQALWKRARRSLSIC